MPALMSKPCLVQTGQGFSISYNGRFLYSKYAPKKAIEQTVAGLQLLPGTLIVCASPCLCYGLEALLAKMPENCFIVGIEADENLYALAKEEVEKIRQKWLQEKNEANTDINDSLSEKFALLEPDELLDIVEIISSGKSRSGKSLPPVHTFRRAILLEMSGGSAFNAELYRKIDGAAEEAIASFWKNRLTLTRLGRLYSRNIFHNLRLIPQSENLENRLKTISRPILVFGAGESAGQTIKSLSKARRQKYFILAVDAALPVLTASGIIPDGIVAVESQLAIEKAYIGCKSALTQNNEHIPLLFADLSSRSQVTRHIRELKGEIVYFISDFADTDFLSRLQQKGLLPPRLPALGSVGLTATYLALLLRAEPAIPVFVTGLDFSFSLGLSHTRGAPAHISRLSKTKRLMPPANYDAAFRPGARFTGGKNGPVCTDQALSGYAAHFAGVFSGVQNLFDIGKSGLSLGIPAFDFEKNEGGLIPASKDKKNPKAACKHERANEIKQKTEAFIKEERRALLRLKELLMQGQKAASETMSVQEEISSLLHGREYLYLHFPDGYACRSCDIDFLKRVRSEIDFFLKDLR